jgi:Protein kinase domain
LIQIVEAIADGSPVDWAGGLDEAVAGTDALRELRVIAELAAVHRQLTGGDSARSLGDVLSAASAESDRSKGVPWGPLLVLDEVGGGSFGRVYRAWDPSLDHEVALKRLRLPADTSASRAASIVREGQLLARVRHQNVITVHGAREINGEVGIWMDFVRGKTLEQIVRDEGPMSAEEASVIGESLCRALAAVHQAGLLHLDIKASNVMREAGGRIVVLDFGTSNELEPENHGGPQRLVGTPLYMAPELLAGGKASVQTDIYSLGVLLFQLTTGTFPVQGKSLAQIRSAHRAGSRRFLSDLRPDLPGSFVRVVERALSPQPDARYQSAGMMLAELKESPIAAPARSVWFPWIGVIVLAIVACPWLAGLVTSLQLNLTLGRVGGFADAPLAAYWIHGFNALFAPAVYVLATALIGRFFVRVCRRGARLLGAFLPRRWLDNARGSCDRIVRRFRNIDPATMVDALILAQVIALVALCWIFAGVLNASWARVSVSDPEIFSPLRPGSLVRHAFRISFSIAIFVMAAAWATVVRRARTPLNGTGVAAGIALIGIVVVLLVGPYRLIWKNEFERVDFGGVRCYITGIEQENVLLYCPDAQVPKVRIVARGDPAMKRLNTLESIFSTR